jgi:hypothetical protein
LNPRHRHQTDVISGEIQLENFGLPFEVFFDANQNVFNPNAAVQ